MSQDLVADILNQVMNAKKARKKSITIVGRTSKLLLNVLDLMKESGYIDYKVEEKNLEIEFKDLSECKAIKPRFNVRVKDLDKYVRRFLPARDFGFVIVSTNKGLMTHYDAKEKNMGGCLIAHCF